jgi:UDP-N-acetylglucosamine/UDP-N-acetylgalactosamine diphosphorylase
MKPVPPPALTARLSSLGQAHLLQFWPQLDPARRDRLIEAVTALDWDQIPLMRRLIDDPPAAAAGPIAPAPVASLDAGQRRRATAEGEAALRAGKVAVLLVAGGQGSRLGFDGPKGAFSIGPISGASLFAIHTRKLLALEHHYGCAIPFLIMTSRANDAETRAFFEQQAYFGLPPERFHFFTQGMLPAMLPDRRLVLETPDQLFLAPDGHGGVLAAMKRAGLFNELNDRGIETVFYFQVDNPMVRIADPAFIGWHRLQQAQVSVKVCAKRDPDEGLGVVALRNGRTVIVEYTELTQAQKTERQADGTLRFGAGSVAIHGFALDFLARQADQPLPLHRAFKKIPVCGPDGQRVAPPAPNGYKFERFIFDVLPLADRVAVVSFDRDEEFAPVKNAAGDDSPASTRSALINDACRRLEACGVAIPRDARGAPRFAVEIDPLYAIDTETLRRRLPPDFTIDGSTLLA